MIKNGTEGFIRIEDLSPVKVGFKCQTCGGDMSLNRGSKFPICDDCLKVLAQVIKERKEKQWP
jgi:peptide subunit release factor 1 (eRF1)